MDIRLRSGVVIGIALQDSRIEQALAEIILGFVVGDGPLLRLAIGTRLALPLHLCLALGAVWC